jgi:hypothetical protein
MSKPKIDFYTSNQWYEVYLVWYIEPSLSTPRKLRVDGESFWCEINQMYEEYFDESTEFFEECLTDDYCQDQFEISHEFLAFVQTDSINEAKRVALKNSRFCNVDILYDVNIAADIFCDLRAEMVDEWSHFWMNHPTCLLK